jgi:hypothetical protein
MDDLALGDHDADRPQLGYQARHGDLTLMILQQHEAAQLRPKVTSNFGRHWCEDGLPVGRQPAFPADTHDMRAQHQILDDEVLVALRAGCKWKSVIGYSRFDDIKDLAIGNRYAVLMGKPFE